MRWAGGDRDRGRGEDSVPNVVGQREQDGVVVLEERAFVVLEQPFADHFVDGGFLISQTDVAVKCLSLSTGLLVVESGSRVIEVLSRSLGRGGRHLFCRCICFCSRLSEKHEKRGVIT